MERRLASGELQKRIFSSVVLMVPTVLAIWQGGVLAAFFVAILGFWGVYEWLAIVRPHRFTWMLLACWIAIATVAAAAGSMPRDAAFSVLLLAALCLFQLDIVLEPPERQESSRSLKQAFWLTSGLLYIGSGCLGLLMTRSGDLGLLTTIFLVLVVWVTDISAYGFGRWLQGPKLAPKISPSKTWSGAIGGMVLASMVGYGFALVISVHKPMFVTGIAALLSGAAQAGDLFESWIKRLFGVKDSGRMLPGHGGLLDRIDGLIFAAILMVALQELGNYIAW